jgi:hypothetical protein
MSREWLNSPDNPAMAEWVLDADDLHVGVAAMLLLASPVLPRVTARKR